MLRLYYRYRCHETRIGLHLESSCFRRNSFTASVLQPYRNHDGTTMASLTLKGLPETLLERLRNRAKEERRSLNQQAIRMLEEALEPPQHTYAGPQSPAMLREPTHQLPPPLKLKGGPITTEEIEAAIEEGRA